MGGENGDSFSRDRAELFEALGHPTRIKIIQALSESPLRFADLKRRIGIESNGLISFHIGKLDGLVKISPEGDYQLTDEGREALRIVAIRDATPQLTGRKRFGVAPLQIVAVIIIIILATTTYLSYAENQAANSSLNASMQANIQLKVANIDANYQLQQENGGLHNILNMLMGVSSPSPPISESQALQTALKHGGWNMVSLQSETVTIDLELLFFTGSSGQYEIVQTNVSWSLANYSSWKVGDSTFRYAWSIFLKPYSPIATTGFYLYLVDAATGEVLN